MVSVPGAGRSILERIFPAMGARLRDGAVPLEEAPHLFFRVFPTLGQFSTCPAKFVHQGAQLGGGHAAMSSAPNGVVAEGFEVLDTVPDV